MCAVDAQRHEEVGAFVRPCAHLLQTVIHEHIATGKKIYASVPMLVQHVPEQIDLQTMPVTLQRFSVLVRQLDVRELRHPVPFHNFNYRHVKAPSL